MNSIVKIPSTATADCCTLIQVIPIPIPRAPRVGMSKPVARPRRTGRTYGPWSNLPGKNEKRGYDINTYLFTTHLNCTKWFLHTHAGPYTYVYDHVCNFATILECIQTTANFPFLRSFSYRGWSNSIFQVFQDACTSSLVHLHIISYPNLQRIVFSCGFRRTCSWIHSWVAKKQTRAGKWGSLTDT